MKRLLIIALIAIAGCSGGEELSDAYGNFEATEITVSAETAGKLIYFNLEEGDKIEKGRIVGLIDTTQLALQKNQLLAKRAAISSNVNNIIAQINVLKEQIKTAEKNRNRVKSMLSDGAATEKQLDDINGQIDVLKKQINAIETQNAQVLSEVRATDAQLEMVKDQIEKCKIKNPQTGRVLGKFIQPGELATPGKPLYKIANLSYLDLRVYVDGAKLPYVELGSMCEALIDKNEKEKAKMEGKVIWISSESEFTPKLIQTKEERVNLVYAVKVRVKNDGRLKIGMPGEVNFPSIEKNKEE